MDMTSPGNLVRAGGWRRDAVNRRQVEVCSVRCAMPTQGGALNKRTRARDRRVFTANIRQQERPGLA